MRRLLRCFFRGYAQGGEMPVYRPRPGERLMMLSPGRRIDDPDEAEALGMTADAKRMRRQGEPSSAKEGRFPPGFIDRINQGRRL
ncbi:hypothetical protein [Streptomyces sp. NPDC088794]|uniref:hypothetical protein n=1 Tax=Streptomyces sp. NPDC088794 TaxID=3365902 RepID=UPI0038162767